MIDVPADSGLDVHGVQPRVPMIPQLRSEGRCHGRTLRNLRAILGRTPTREDLGLRWWQDARLDFVEDVVTVGLRRVAWVERLFETLYSFVMWWTKDVPRRLVAYFGPARTWNGSYRDPDARPRVGDRYGDWRWPHVIDRVWTDHYTRGRSQLCWATRRMKLSEWLRGAR